MLKMKTKNQILGKFIKQSATVFTFQQIIKYKIVKCQHDQGKH